MKPLVSVLIFIVVVAATVQVDAAHADTPLSGSISGTLTLANSPYALGDASVDRGNVLTIESGVLIKATGISSRLAISGSLQALGTQTLPIVFTSNAGTPGSWSGIEFGEWSCEMSSLMQFCEVRNGGGEGGPYAAAVRVNGGPWGGLNTQPTMEDCTISGSGKYGLETYNNSQVTLNRVHFAQNADVDFMMMYNVSGQAPSLTDCDFDTGSHAGFSSGGNNARTHLAALTRCTFSGTGDYGLYVPAMAVDGGITTSGYVHGVYVFTSEITADRLWTSPGPGQIYVLDDAYNSNGDRGVMVINGATLTISPGVTIKGKSAQCGLHVRYYGDGALQALGTQEQPIVFTSLSGQPGGWIGIRFYGHATGLPSLMRFCQVRNGAGEGGDYAANVIDTGGGSGDRHLTMEDCTITGSAKYGFETYNDSQPTLTRVHFTGNASTDFLMMYCVPGQAPTLTDCDFSTGSHLGFDSAGNNYNRHLANLTECTFTGTGEYGVRLPAMVAGSGFTMSGYAHGVYVFTSEITANRLWTSPGPGQIYVLDDAPISVNATLTVSPGVTIKGKSPASSLQIGFYGAGGLVAIGTASQPILFTSLSGAPGGWGGIFMCGEWVGALASRLEYCTIMNGAAYNLKVRQQAPGNPTLYKCRLTNASGLGMHLEYSAPTLSCCLISGNAQGGGDSWGTAIADARGCWWGAASGPYDPSTGSPLHNPLGTGQLVSDWIDYGSWLTEPPCLATRTITATAGAGGSISPSGPSDVPCDMDQEYTITPDPSYQIADVVVDGSSVGTVERFTVTPRCFMSGQLITATFVPLPTQTITATAGPNGSITPAGDVVVNTGTNQDFTISPAAGYHITDVLVDGASVGAVSAYAFTNVTANHTIAASFAPTLRNLAGTALLSCGGSNSPAEGVVVRLLNEGEPFLETATDAGGAYRFADVRVGTYTVAVIPPPGYGIDVDTRLVTITDGADPLQIEPFEFTCLHRDLIGRVEGTCNGGAPTGYEGIVVDLFHDDGTGTDVLVGTTITDAQGSYRFENVALSDYTIGIVTPLGFTADANQQEITIPAGADPMTVPAFSIRCINVVAQPRTIGYWKHQVSVYLTGKGTAQETLADLLSYIDLIIQHFNENHDNPIVLYNPPSDDTTDRLRQLESLLTVNRGGTMQDRAKQQLLALLLNVVSVKISQMQIVSDNGAVVSQAITYGYELITDGIPSNDETAKTISDLINNNQRVPSGMIPTDTRLITYRENRGSEEGRSWGTVLRAIYPNPSKSVFLVTFTLADERGAMLEVVDVRGRCLIRKDLSGSAAGEHVVEFGSEANLPAGIYGVRLSQAGRTQVRTIAIIR